MSLDALRVFCFPGVPSLSLDSHFFHNCSSLQTLLLRDFFFLLGGGPYSPALVRFPVVGLARERGGRVGSSLAERSFMVTRDTL